MRAEALPGGPAGRACGSPAGPDPRDVAVAALDGIEAGAHEVLADDTTRWVKSQLSADLEALYPQLNK